MLTKCRPGSAGKRHKTFVHPILLLLLLPWWCLDAAYCKGFIDGLQDMRSVFLCRAVRASPTVAPSESLLVSPPQARVAFALPKHTRMFDTHNKPIFGYCVSYCAVTVPVRCFQIPLFIADPWTVYDRAPMLFVHLSALSPPSVEADCDRGARIS